MASGGRLLIDGNNVMGSRPDGWWRDRAAAKVRLAGEIADWAARAAANRPGRPAPVLLYFDGRSDPAIVSAGAGLSVRFAERPGRDAADHLIVEEARPGDTVVTADRGLIERLAEGVKTMGPSRLLTEVGATVDRSASRSGPGTW